MSHQPVPPEVTDALHVVMDWMRNAGLNCWRMDCPFRKGMSP